jgi:hypothetical protein
LFGLSGPIHRKGRAYIFAASPTSFVIPDSFYIRHEESAISQLHKQLRENEKKMTPTALLLSPYPYSHPSPHHAYQAFYARNRFHGFRAPRSGGIGRVLKIGAVVGIGYLVVKAVAGR